MKKSKRKPVGWGGAIVCFSLFFLLPCHGEEKGRQEGRKVALAFKGKKPPIQYSFDKWSDDLSWSLLRAPRDKRWHDKWFQLFVTINPVLMNKKNLSYLFLLFVIPYFCLVICSHLRRVDAVIIGVLVVVGCYRYESALFQGRADGYNTTMRKVSASWPLRFKKQVLLEHRRQIHLLPFQIAANSTRYSNLSRGVHWWRKNATKGWRLRDLLALLISIIVGLVVMAKIHKTFHKRRI